MLENRNIGKKLINFLSKYWIFILIFVLIGGGVFAGVQIYKDEVKDPTLTLEYEEQNYISLATEYIDTLNPAISNSADIYNISQLVYDSLFSYDENMQAVPNLVESFTVNTDRAGIEIVLKDNIYFSDGQKLTYQDVINSITALKTAGLNSPYYDKVVKITQYYVNYDNKLAIWFRNNYQCSLDDLTFPIFSSKISAYKIGTSKTTVPAGSGQYVYGEYDKYNQLTLVPNETHHGEKATKNLYFKIVPNRKYASNLLKINDINCYLDASDTRKSTAIETKSVVYDIPSNSVDFLVFNSKNSQYTMSKEFRKAIVDCIDFNQILEKAYLNDGVLTDTIYYPNFYGTEDTLENAESKIDIAMTALEDLGYKDLNDDRYLENPYGEKVSLSIVVNKNNSVRVAAAKLIKKQLDVLGIWSEVEILDQNEYNNAMAINHFDILLTGYSFSEEFDLRFLFSGENPWYFYDYSLLTYARNLDRFYTLDQYREHYRELKSELLSQNVYVPLCYKYMSLVGCTTFEADLLPTWNNPFRNIDSWRWKLEKEVEILEDLEQK